MEHFSPYLQYKWKEKATEPLLSGHALFVGHGRGAPVLPQQKRHHFSSAVVNT